MDDAERLKRGAAAAPQECWAMNRTTARPEQQQSRSIAEWLDIIITRSPWGDVWTRPHFDDRTRRILVIGTMIALDRWDEFELHVRGALTVGGFTADDIKEIILQQSSLLRRTGRQPCLASRNRLADPDRSAVQTAEH